MNIFILNTGRCGSTTIIKACQHITNYTCAHESRSGIIGQEHFDYPKNHIEADNRLSWLLGRLDRTYGDDAFYVHLKRDDSETAHSFTKRHSSGIIKAYRADILMGLPVEIPPMSVALDYCDTVNSNIELFLKDKNQKMEIRLDVIDEGFVKFWQAIGAEGDIDAALEEFKTCYNVSKQPKTTTLSSVIPRILLKLKRLIVKLPNYIKNT